MSRTANRKLVIAEKWSGKDIVCGFVIYRFVEAHPTRIERDALLRRLMTSQMRTSTRFVLKKRKNLSQTTVRVLFLTNMRHKLFHFVVTKQQPTDGQLFVSQLISASLIPNASAIWLFAEDCDVMSINHVSHCVRIRKRKRTII